MNLDNFDKVAELRTRHAELTAIRNVAYSGALFCTLNGVGSARYDVGFELSDEPVRAAIGEMCADQLRDVEKKLSALGVRVKNPEPAEDGTADEWRSRAASLQHAWYRELGQHFVPKSHLIDALVVSTRRLVEKAAKLVLMTEEVERLLAENATLSAKAKAFDTLPVIQQRRALGEKL